MKITFVRYTFMFQIELKFKIHDRDVSWDRFAAAFIREALKTPFDEIRQEFTSTAPTPASPSTFESKNPNIKPQIVNVDDAARMLGLKSSTVRAYIAKRKIASVRIGRRVLVPTAAIHELITAGLRPAH
jgi:excisionase family DNA binding protein